MEKCKRREGISESEYESFKGITKEQGRGKSRSQNIRNKYTRRRSIITTTNERQIGRRKIKPRKGSRRSF